ncbi:MAG: hypothetical protein ACTS1Z_11555 [Parasphingopyxis sp.]
MDQIILLCSVLLGLLGASFCLHTSVIAGQPVKRLRAAIGAAGVIFIPVLLYPVLSGWIWLPWL